MTNRTLPVDASALMAAATAHAGGLKDFGEASFRPALESLLRSVRQEARMSPAGQALFAQRVLESLCNRLTLEHYCARHPEITAERIQQPAVLVGLPRTGTTMLHRLLAPDAPIHTMAGSDRRC